MCFGSSIACIKHCKTCSLVFDQDWYEDGEFKKLLTSGKKNAAAVRQVFQEMYEQLINHHGSESDLYSQDPSQSVPSNIGMGPYRTKFAKVGRGGMEFSGLSYMIMLVLSQCYLKIVR